MVEAIINLSALRHNTRLVRALAPQSAVLAVIKANAYGHGLVQVARALESHVDGFAVARIDEALELRQQGIQLRTVLLSERPELAQLLLCSRHALDVVVHDVTTANLLAQAQLPRPIGIWLKIDSGMHRLGIEPGQARVVFESLSAAPAVGEIVLMSHFASAEDVHNSINEQQLAHFDHAMRNVAAPASLANSAAIITRPDTHRQWVRPGIMLYGANPLGETAEPKLRTVMTLQSELLAVRDIGAGEGVGYNHNWISSVPSRIGTVAIGYGDGYPRQAGNGTPVLVNGRRAPLAGRVSMDTLTVDLSQLPEARPGDKVMLWGDQLAVNEIADHAGTIAYELLTRITRRVRFSYRDD